MSIAFKDTWTATAGREYIIAPKPWDSNKIAVTNPIKSITASIAWVSTMVQNILENSAKEILYPLRNGLVNYAHLLRHPIKTVNQDSVMLVPKLIATPITSVLSSFTWAVRSVLNTPEDLSQWLWQTPIDATTAWTIGQFWAIGRWIHYAWKIFSTTPRLLLNYTTSLLWTWIDIVWDATAKISKFDAVPDAWMRYVTPSSLSLQSSSDNDKPLIAASADNAVMAGQANNAVIADSAQNAIREAA